MAPRANVMIFTDASLCGKTGAAGWGAWIKRDGGVSQVFGDGFRDKMGSSIDAELAAIANAVHRALAWRLIETGDTLMIQSDNLEALARIRQAIPAAFDNPAPGGLPAAAAKRRQKHETARLAAEKIKTLADEFSLTVVVRHVRGHQEGRGRQWVNSKCDEVAKHHRKARAKAMRAALAKEIGDRPQAPLQLP